MGCKCSQPEFEPVVDADRAVGPITASERVSIAIEKLLWDEWTRRRGTSRHVKLQDHRKLFSTAALAVREQWAQLISRQAEQRVTMALRARGRNDRDAEKLMGLTTRRLVDEHLEVLEFKGTAMQVWKLAARRSGGDGGATDGGVGSEGLDEQKYVSSVVERVRGMIEAIGKVVIQHVAYTFVIGYPGSSQTIRKQSQECAARQMTVAVPSR